MNNTEIYKHLFNRAYMSGLEREQIRIKATGEVFTPSSTVNDILDEIEELDPQAFTNSTKTVIDNSCGDGQFLASALYRKVDNGIDFETALSTIYGVDIMEDNVKLCRTRLLCGREDLRHIVERNIICHDALTYDYSFNGTNKNNDELRFDTLFD